MASWRDSTSQQAQDDLDGLLNAVLPLAERLIATHGEMYPFGAAVTMSGALAVLAADADLGDHPAALDVLTAVYAGARRSRQEHRAVAFATDVRTNGPDAVRVELEHRDGPALVLLVPYSRDGSTKTVTLGEITAAPGERHVWDD